MAIDLDKLEELAKKATPGPWHWDSDAVKGDPFARMRYRVTTVGKTITQIYYSSYEGGPTNAEDDAAFISAANPAAILELIRMARAGQKEVCSAVDKAKRVMELVDRYCELPNADRRHDLRCGLMAELEQAEAATDEYGATDFGFTFAGIALQDGDKRLMALLISALGSDHPAIDDMTALLWRANGYRPKPSAGKEGV